MKPSNEYLYKWYPTDDRIASDRAIKNLNKRLLAKAASVTIPGGSQSLDPSHPPRKQALKLLLAGLTL